MYKLRVDIFAGVSSLTDFLPRPRSRRSGDLVIQEHEVPVVTLDEDEGSNFVNENSADQGQQQQEQHNIVGEESCDGVNQNESGQQMQQQQDHQQHQLHQVVVGG